MNDEITDKAVFAEFRERIAATVEVRGGTTEVIEGDWIPHRIVVVEFDNIEQARACNFGLTTESSPTPVAPDEEACPRAGAPGIRPFMR